MLTQRGPVFIIPPLSEDDIAALRRVARQEPGLPFVVLSPEQMEQIPSSDLEDLLLTIDDAPPSWKAQGYPTALAEVRDMAAVGRALIEAIAEATKPGAQLAGWAPADSPVEIVADLLNRLHDVSQAGRAVIDNAATTYRAGNGRDVGIEDDSGERVMLVPHEDWHNLRALVGEA